MKNGPKEKIQISKIFEQNPVFTLPHPPCPIPFILLILKIK
jgi:hypothetical protein